MKDRQRDKLVMYQLVLRFSKKNRDTWSGLEAFGSTLSELDTRILEIDALRVTQEIDITGVSGTKQQVKDVLIDHLEELIGSLEAYATEIEELNLLERIYYTPSALRQTSATELVGISKLVLNEGEKYLESIKSFGVTAKSLAELDKKIKAFNVILTAPRQAIIDRSMATDGLKDAIRITDALLKRRLDKLALRFRKKAPEFYNRYKKARRVIASAGTASPSSLPLLDKEGGGVISIEQRPLRWGG